jgi:hypothetical protein
VIDHSFRYEANRISCVFHSLPKIDILHGGIRKPFVEPSNLIEDGPANHKVARPKISAAQIHRSVVERSFKAPNTGRLAFVDKDIWLYRTIVGGQNVDRGNTVVVYEDKPFAASAPNPAITVSRWAAIGAPHVSDYRCVLRQLPISHMIHRDNHFARSNRKTSNRYLKLGKASGK